MYHIHTTTPTTEDFLPYTGKKVDDPEYDGWGGTAKQAMIKYSVGVLATSTLWVGVDLQSIPYRSETTESYVNASSTKERLDQKRDDLQLIARIRELGTYKDGWDGLDGKAPTHKTVKDSERFARLLLRESLHAPHVSLATDGEINFFWNLPGFRFDLGFFGDGTYSYYGENSQGKEFMADDQLTDKPLPEGIIRLLGKS